MQLVALGKLVTNAGTRLQLTSDADNRSVRFVKIRALFGNTNNVSVGDVTVVAATGVGVMDVLDSSVELVIDGQTGNPIDATEIYFDVDTNGEGITAFLGIE